MTIINTIRSIDKNSLRNIYQKYCKGKLYYYFEEDWFVNIGMEIRQFLLNAEEDILFTDDLLQQISAVYDEYILFEKMHLYNGNHGYISAVERKHTLKIVTQFLYSNSSSVEYITDVLNSGEHESWNGYVLLIQAYKIALKQAFDAIAAWIENKQKPLQRPPKRAVSKNSTVANKKERSQGGDKTYGEQERSAI